ncbi:MAG: dephospho-CoA kinase, partial [Flavobacteriales bacterium]
MKRIGLTGGIGSGKSTIARAFEVLGAPVFKADLEGKRALNEDPELINAVKERFGKNLYGSDGLDREKMARMVFKDPQKLEELNGLVHPKVRERFNAWCEDRKGAPYVIEEAAILIESGAYRDLDHTILVTAPEEMRIQRV